MTEETMKARVTAAIVEQLREQGVARGVAVDIDGDLAQVDGSFRLGPIVGAVIAAMREDGPPVPILASKDATEEALREFRVEKP